MAGEDEVGGVEDARDAIASQPPPSTRLPGGTLTLRYQADDLNAPKAGGAIELLHLWVRQEYVTGILGSSFFPEITTTVNLYTPRV